MKVFLRFGLGIVTLHVVCALAGATPPPRPAVPAPAPATRFYERIVGDWVGVSVSRLEDQPPSTCYFSLTVTRTDPRTFREAFTFYRRHPQTGALETSGTQTNLAVLEANEQMRCTA